MDGIGRFSQDNGLRSSDRCGSGTERETGTENCPNDMTGGKHNG